MNDIICGAKFLLNLLEKLGILFDIFLEYNIFIKPTKSFFNYPNIGFPGQRVKFLSLTTSKEELKVINLLTYPETLGALEYHLRLISYVCNFIHLYARLAGLLQTL